MTAPTTTSPETPTTIFGVQVPQSEWTPLRSVIAQPERSAAGNIVLRIGRELSAGGWHQTQQVVLTPQEASALAATIRRRLAASE